MVVATVLLGALAGCGLFAMVVGLQTQRVQPNRGRLRSFQSRAASTKLPSSAVYILVMAALAALLGFGAWYVTGWVAVAILGATAGVMGPIIWRTPRQRRKFIDEVEAYSQWTEQVRDLVAATGSLHEAVSLSANQAPSRLRPQVLQMASIARTLGLPPALDWFSAEMNSPFADRLVLGMRIAWDSGSRVTEAFANTARAMRAEVEMRRRHEVANARAWTQAVAIVGITVGAVVFMFVFNRGFFDPFGTTTGQAVLLGAGALIFFNIYWVLKLSESRAPVRLLADDTGRAFEAAAAAASAARGDE